MTADDEPGVLNIMIEDYLANSDGGTGDHAMMLSAWLQLGAEYLARAAGRQYALDATDNLRRFVRDAQPAKPWKP